MNIIDNYLFELRLLGARRRYAATRTLRLKCAAAQGMLFLVPILAGALLAAGAVWGLA